MNEIQRHRWTFKILMPFIDVFLKWKFNYKYDELGEIEGPYLLLSNHNLELDPALIGRSVGHQLYFVASEHVLRKGLGTWFLMTFFKPIIHLKGRQGVATVKQMLKTLHEGHSICIFPEGNRSFNGLTGTMQTAIGKVAKKSKAKLITYRLEGGYFTQPRWSVNLRRGKLRGRLINVYTPEQLHEMTDEQINTAIINDLYEDAYETQSRERIAFHGKNLALGLESAVFACPHCGQMGKLHSEGNRLSCECGYEMDYDVYGDLTGSDEKKYTVTELDRLQKQVLKETIKDLDAEEILFEDSVTVYYINEKHELETTKDLIMKAGKEFLEWDGVRVSYDKLEGMAIYSRSALLLHHKEKTGHLEVKSKSISFNALKYLYLYQMHKKEADR